MGCVECATGETGSTCGVSVVGDDVVPEDGVVGMILDGGGTGVGGNASCVTRGGTTSTVAGEGRTGVGEGSS